MDIERQQKERAFWEKFAGRYDSFMKHLKPAYNQLLNYIKKDIRPGSTVLEIAMGTGLIALEIAPYVKKLYGCDLSPEMIGVAKRKAEEAGITGYDFSVQDGHDLNYRTGYFDAVIACNVLHVMIDPDQVLQSVRRVLKKDGIFIAPTYCHGQNIVSRLISSAMSLAGFKAYNKWSLSSYREFIEKNNFSITTSHVIKDKIPLSYIVAKKI